MKTKKWISILIFLFIAAIPATLMSAIQDSDSDFMPDTWEIQYGLNHLDKTDAFLDMDSDGYTNLEEYGAGTRPDHDLSIPIDRPAAELVLRGKSLLENKELVAANAAFEFAVKADNTNQEANLFYSVTRLLEHIERNMDDGNPDNLDNVKEVLDKSGISAAGRTLYNWTADFQRDSKGDVILHESTPTGKEIQGSLLDYVLPEIDEALFNLSQINESFRIVITPKMFGQNWMTFNIIGDIEVDYGDIALLKASLHAVKAMIYIKTAYNEDIDLYDIYKMIKSDTPSIINQILHDYPDLLTIARQGNFAEARSSLSEAIDMYFKASAFIRNETDNQLDDLVSIDPVDLPDEENFRLVLTDIKKSLNGPTDIWPGNTELRDPTGDYLRTDLTRFFDYPVSLRDYLPAFVANRPCSVPEPTWNGIFPYLSDEDWSIFFDEFDDLTVFSGHWSDGYYADMYFDDWDRDITSITATGPGIQGTLKFQYMPSLGEWWAEDSPYLGPQKPSVPQTYTITTSDAFGDCSYEKTITGYVEDFATYLSPTGEVGGYFNFYWVGIPDADRYQVQLDSPDIVNPDAIDPYRLWDSYDAGTYWTSVYYYGPHLTQGETYNYTIVSEIETDEVSNYSFTEASFLYRGIDEYPVGIIFGKVTANGSPVPWVRVVANTYQLPYDYGYGYNDIYTDASGNYIISGLTPGFYRVKSDGNGIYEGKFHDNTHDRSLATPVTVVAGVTTKNIDFDLSESTGHSPHEYDADGNWIIGDFELLDAIDYWAMGKIGDFDLLDLIDYWAAGSYCRDSAAGKYKAGIHDGTGICQE